MRNLSKEKILKKLDVIFREAKPPTDFDPNNGNASLFMSDGVGFVLSGEGLEAFNAAVDGILEDAFFGDNFSNQYAQGVVRSLIASNLNDYLAGNLNIEEKLNEKIEELRGFNETYTVLIRLGGIAFEKSKALRIGNSLIRKYRKNDLFLKRVSKIQGIRYYLKELEGKVICLVEVNGYIRISQKP